MTPFEELQEAVQRAMDALNDAEEEQWQMPPNPCSSDGRGSDIADPTANIALDARRLRVRAEILKIERETRESMRKITQALDDLEKAMHAWMGTINLKNL